MDTNIIVAVSTVAGAAIGGLFSLLASRSGEHLASLERDLAKAKEGYAKACTQVAAYYELEQAYMARLAELSAGNARTIQKELRDQVEAATGIRPQWTAYEAKRRSEDV